MVYEHHLHPSKSAGIRKQRCRLLQRGKRDRQDIDQGRNGDELNPPPQLQFLTMDCRQYAALANWVKEVKLDISAADIRVTALVTRLLSTTSGIPWGGIAPTEIKSSTAATRREVVEKKDESILNGCQKRGKGRDTKRRLGGGGGDHRTNG